MAQLHILREHTLGLPAARKIAVAWAEQVESDFDMQCTYEEGANTDAVMFVRSGVSGTLQVTNDRFELDAKLGFLLGTFKGRIEAEIVKNLDNLLAKKSTVKVGAKPPAKKSVTKK